MDDSTREAVIAYQSNMSPEIRRRVLTTIALEAAGKTPEYAVAPNGSVGKVLSEETVEDK